MEQVSPIEVEKFLRDLDYPAEKDAILGYARNNGADEEVLAMLDALPEQEYGSPADISEALGRME